MNSREKGKRGERAWRDELRAQGFLARRGQQFAGGAESPDVVCESLPWVHFEVKAVERLNIGEAMEQARCDSRRIGKFEVRNPKSEGGEKVPIVAHRRSFRAWLVTMEAETFFRLLRGELGVGENNEDAKTRRGQGAEIGNLKFEISKEGDNGSGDGGSHLSPALSPRGGEGEQEGRDRDGDEVEALAGGHRPYQVLADGQRADASARRPYLGRADVSARRPYQEETKV